MDDLRLKLISMPRGKHYTEGELFYENKGERLCDTLEDEIRDFNGDGDLEDEGEHKVYGETAIMRGVYSIRVSFSPAFGMPMVEILNVRYFTGIRMHWGATAKNSKGCILCGEKIKHGILIDSGMTFKLVELLKRHNNRGTIEII